MKRHAALFVFLLASGAQAASAQSLTPQQAHGRQILTQNCNICHLPQNPGSATYGPRLSKSSANGDDKLMKQVIQTGLVKMPGWRYALKDSDIDDVIAYVRTLPEPPPPTTRGGGLGAD
ncbi:MAG TPA: cytochrome c [Micropepsaceae bacterium]